MGLDVFIAQKEQNAIHLDFAAGTGRFLRNIIVKTRGEIIALERDYRACLELQYLLKKIKKYKRISVVCADARKMPFKSEVFDSISAWHGLDEPKMVKAVEEVRRVLKNGAWVVASGLHYNRGSKSFLIAKKRTNLLYCKRSNYKHIKKSRFSESKI